MGSVECRVGAPPHCTIAVWRVGVVQFGGERRILAARRWRVAVGLAWSGSDPGSARGDGRRRSDYRVDTRRPKVRLAISRVSSVLRLSVRIRGAEFLRSRYVRIAYSKMRA